MAGDTRVQRTTSYAHRRRFVVDSTLRKSHKQRLHHSLADMRNLGKVWLVRAIILFSRILAVNKLKNFLRITEAAEYLGVSPNTLRNWENAGKIAAHRHPVNGYRLFKQEELDALLNLAERLSTTAKDANRKPR